MLNHIDKDKYNIFPVGITKDGDWILFGGKDYGMLPAGTWQNCEENRRAAISPVRGQGLLSFENDCVVRERIDVVFPVMHGENCEDGAIQGLLQIAGIPYVGPHVAASAACMDKTITKLIASQAGVRQADWQLVTREGFARSRAAVLDAVEAKFPYPVFVKPAGTGSSVGVAKAQGREALEAAIEAALKYDRKVLVEEFIRGQEVEVAVLGNENPFASVCGEIDSGAEFYDYEAKYISDSARLYIPARIAEQTAEQVREQAVRVYTAMGCRGLSRVDFFRDAGRRHGLQRDQHHPRLHVHFHVPQAFRGQRHPYQRAHRRSDRARAGGVMVQAAKISITGTQRMEGVEPETLGLVTEGSYCYEPGLAIVSYVESEMTGLEGVVTSFTVEDGRTVTLRRTGKLNAEMRFVRGQAHDSLYDMGFGAMMISVVTEDMTILLNEHGGVLDLEYRVEVEHALCSRNHYHIEIRTI